LWGVAAAVHEEQRPPTGRRELEARRAEDDAVRADRAARETLVFNAARV
jgi:hypothetical protein